MCVPPLEKTFALYVGAPPLDVASLTGLSSIEWIVPINCAPEIVGAKRAPNLGSTN